MNHLFPQNWIAYLDVGMVFLRLLGLFILIPVFSHRSIPNAFKVLLALVMSFAILPILKPYLPATPHTVEGIALFAIRETAIGFLMGFIAFITFEAIHLAAQFIGYQMGFGTVGLMDPVNHASVSVLVPFCGWMALMAFFMLDMHHYLLKNFVVSFEVTKNLDENFYGNPDLMKLFVSAVGTLFVVAIKIAAPITLLVLLANTAVGILSRLLPQMHVILFAFPVTILLGLCTLYLIAPNLLAAFENVVGEMWVNTTRFLEVI